MAFPVVQSRTNWQGANTDTTSHAPGLPTGSLPGDVLLVVFSVDGAPTCTADAASQTRGWLKLGQATDATSQVTGAVFYKIASGDDALTITTSVAEQASAVSWRIAHASGVITGTAATGSSTNPNPPAHVPAGGSGDYLWIATASRDASGGAAVHPSAAPAGYGNLQTVAAGTTAGALTASAEITATAATQDPGVFTAATEQWVSWTIAVAPEPPVSFRYFRFWPFGVRGGFTEPNMQISEFAVLNGGTRLTGMSVSVDLTRGQNRQATGFEVAEGPAMAADNNTATKWLNEAQNTAGAFTGAPLVYDFGALVQATGYRWATGNDFPQRDPAAWALDASLDGVSWLRLDVRNGLAVTTTRAAAVGDFAFTAMLWSRADTAACSDTAARTTAAVRQVTDVAAAQDAVSQSGAAGSGGGFGSAPFGSTPFGGSGDPGNVTVGDSASATDSVTFSGAGSFALADQVAGQDAAARTAASVRSAADPGATADAVRVSLTKRAADSAAVSDGVTQAFVPGQVELATGGQLDVALFAVVPGGLAALPHFVSLDLSPIQNAAGAVKVDYPVNGHNFDLLKAIVDDDTDVEVAVWLQGQHAGSMRAVLNEASGDVSDPNAVWSFGGTFLEGRMVEGSVGINSALVSKETPFPNATAGTILRTLMQRCQARGELTDITWATFTNTTDSVGAAWAFQASPVFGPKDTLGDVLDSLVESGMIDWEITPNHELKVYNQGSLGRDLTAFDPPIILWAGRSVLDGPRKHSTRDSATHLLVEGKDGLYTEVSDATAVARRGRRITKVVSAANINDLGSLQAYGQAQMQIAARGRDESTHGLVFGAGDPLPLVGFHIGDWIYSGSEAGLVRRRIRQWVLSIRPGDQPQGSVSLNDLFADRALQLERQLKALERGTTAVGTSQPTPTDPSADTVAPAAPTGLTASSLAYVDPTGQPFASVQATWNVVTTNSDATAIDDLLGYDVEWQFNQAGFPTGWQPVGMSITTSMTFSGLPQNVQIQVRVAARDWRGNQSAFSTPIVLVTEDDATPPPTPSAPSPYNHQGVVIIPWNGLGSFGEQMPPDLDHVQIHKSAANNFTATTATLLPLELRGPGSVAYQPTEAELGTTLYFRLIAEDVTGNVSAASAIGSAIPQVPSANVPQELIDAAIENSTVDFTEKIAPKSITTGHLSIASFSDNLTPNGGFEDLSLTDETQPAGWTPGQVSGTTATAARDTSAGNFDSGSASLKVSLSTASGTSRIQSEPIPVRPGDVVLLQARAKASRAVTGFRWRIALFSTDPSTFVGTFQSNAFGLVALTTSFTTLEQQFTVPATLAVGDQAGQAPRFMRVVPTAGEVTGDGAALDVWFDEVRVRTVVGRAEIANAAIGSAQIGLAEITNANIGDVNVGKIVGGTGTFSMLMASGNIRSADSGQRWIIDTAGLRFFNSANVKTLDFATAGTSHYLQGSFEARNPGNANDRIVFQPNSGTGVAEITFWANPTGPAYMNAIQTGSRTTLGLNSGPTADTGSDRKQSTIWLRPTAFDLFVNTAPGDIAGVNARRGGFLQGSLADGDGAMLLGCSDNSANVQSEIGAYQNGKLRFTGVLENAWYNNRQLMYVTTLVDATATNVFTSSQGYPFPMATNRVVSITMEGGQAQYWLTGTSNTSRSWGVSDANAPQFWHLIDIGNDQTGV